MCNADSGPKVRPGRWPDKAPRHRRCGAAFGVLIAFSLLALGGCAANGQPHYCEQSIGERAMMGSGYNPFLLGPALIAATLMEAGCDSDAPPRPAATADTASDSVDEPDLAVGSKKWMSSCMAAVSGDAKEMSRVGFYFYNGNSPVLPDPLQAYAWFRRASDAGYTNAGVMADKIATSHSGEELDLAESALASEEPDESWCKGFVETS